MRRNRIICFLKISWHSYIKSHRIKTVFLDDIWQYYGCGDCEFIREGIAD